MKSYSVLSFFLLLVGGALLGSFYMEFRATSLGEVKCISAKRESVLYEPVEFLVRHNGDVVVKSAYGKFVLPHEDIDTLRFGLNQAKLKLPIFSVVPVMDGISQNISHTITDDYAYVIKLADFDCGDFNIWMCGLGLMQKNEFFMICLFREDLVAIDDLLIKAKYFKEISEMVKYT